LFQKKNHQSQDELNNNKIYISQDICALDLFVHLLLSINKKFFQPEDNIIINLINSTMDDGVHNYKTLSEISINLFNFESLY